MKHQKTTTIKLQIRTKERLDKLKQYPRETYDDVLRKMLHILSLVKIDSDKAKEILEKIEKLRKKLLNPKPEENNN